MRRRSDDARAARRVAPLWAILVAAGTAGWILTAGQARDMGTGPGTMGMAVPAFAGMWVAMMAAMMLPAIGLVASDVALRQRVRFPAASLRTIAFGAGFLLPWAAFGGLAFAALVGTGRLVTAAPSGARWLGVGIVAVAGLYQLSPWKARALAHCRTAAHARPDDGSFAEGIRDGAMCVGCCWALMAVLVATGVMSLPAMAGLAAVIFAEKVLPRPRLIAGLAGVALLGLAVFAAFHPSLLAGVRPDAMASSMMPAMGGM